MLLEDCPETVRRNRSSALFREALRHDLAFPGNEPETEILHSPIYCGIVCRHRLLHPSFPVFTEYYPQPV